MPVKREVTAPTGASPALDPERWQTIKQLIDRAGGRPVEGRRRWLLEQTGADRRMVREVESFLAFEDRLDGFIDEPILALAPGAVETAAETAAEAVGKRVGPYRLVRLLEEGGMGAVFLAERDQEFEQRVALKLVRREALDEAAIRRFHAERQILARLEHPNIARLLDGGTADGMPYFAMELVDGVPIDRFCDLLRLSTRQRLELFLPLCSALSLAHQNLVIHRDLKPANVLVNEHGVPKLLDFGIAERVPSEGDEDPQGARTRHAMTLAFASPEQVLRQQVGTASDVYSLGVVLYKVLSGRLPCQLEGRSQFGIMRAICQVEPVPASQALTLPPSAPPSAQPSESRSESRSNDFAGDDPEPDPNSPEAVARRRGHSVASLRRSLAGDVDAILAKALAKAPEDRYASVDRLAADIRRHLDGLPVSCRPATFRYRAGKFVARHRLALAALAVVVSLALAFSGVLARQFVAIERARYQTEELSTFLVDLFYASDPDRPGAEPTVRDLLERGRAKLDVGLENDPATRARLLRRLGEVYFRLGDYDEAREVFATAVDLRRRLGSDHPDLAAALNNLAAVHYRQGDLEGAERLFRECIDLRRRLGLDEDLIKPMNNLATILQARGELAEAERIYRDSLDLRRAALGSGHPNVAESLRSLATVLLAAGDLDGAEPLLRESLDIRLEVYGPDSTKVAMALVSLGRLEHARGDLEAAERLLTRTLEIRRRELGDEHLHTALAKKDLAAVLLDRGDERAAHVLLEKALETLRRIRPEDDWMIRETEGYLGVYLAATGDPQRAEVCLHQAWQALEETRGAEHADTLAMKRRLDVVRASLAGTS